MGLDMYLKTNSKKVCKAANKASGTDEWYFTHGTAIYWRKANAIHKWFVENVQYGEDDCGTYGVSVYQLIELRDACQKVIEASKLVPGTIQNGYIGDRDGFRPCFEDGMVIEDSSIAEELLPTGDGFFFGSTEYNEWYLQDVIATRDGIDAILGNIEQFEYSPFEGCTWKDWREKGETDEWAVKFEYHASW